MPFILAFYHYLTLCSATRRSEVKPQPAERCLIYITTSQANSCVYIGIRVNADGGSLVKVDGPFEEKNMRFRCMGLVVHPSQRLGYPQSSPLVL